MCCLGYWCPCWLFGRNLRQAAICRNTLSGCVIYMVFAGLIIFAMGALSSRSLSTFEECVMAIRAESNVYDPCVLATGDPGHPACSRQDIQTLIRLEQLMNELGSVPQIIAEETETVGAECLNCVSSLDRPSDQQIQQMVDRAAQSALLCNDKELSRSRLIKLFGWTAMGMFGGLFRELIQSAMQDGATCTGSSMRTPTWRSFGLHCCPLTHQLALCQESRALGATEAASIMRKRAGD